LATADDGALLEQGIALFDSLYRAFSQAQRVGGDLVAFRAKAKRRRR